MSVPGPLPPPENPITGPRLLALTALTVLFFAANSLLTRGALAETAIGPGQFALIRLAAGSVMLGLLVLLSGQRTRLRVRGRATAVLGLWTYMVGFSIAYVWLDAGIGALILFAVVQATMFAGGLLAGERVPRGRWLGMGLAMTGLVFLFLPRIGAAPQPAGVALMIAAAIGFALYSLVGRRSTAPLADTAVNFALATVLAALVPWAMLDPTPSSGTGIALAVLSGAVTSGIGYALWYALMPSLGATRAAVAQLAAPALALAGGALVLAEPVALGAMMAAALILAGVGIAVRARAT